MEPPPSAHIPDSTPPASSSANPIMRRVTRRKTYVGLGSLGLDMIPPSDPAALIRRTKMLSTPITALTPPGPIIPELSSPAPAKMLYPQFKRRTNRSASFLSPSATKIRQLQRLSSTASNRQTTTSNGSTSQTEIDEITTQITSASISLPGWSSFDAFVTSLFHTPPWASSHQADSSVSRSSSMLTKPSFKFTNPFLPKQTKKDDGKDDLPAAESIGTRDSEVQEVQEHGQMTEGKRRTIRKPKYPLILCHGLLGFNVIGPAKLPLLQISYWRGVKEALQEAGCEVYIAEVPASASIEERAKTLALYVEHIVPLPEGGGPRYVNLIGHSMGGLDCRYLISHLKCKSIKAVSLTTIATPHRGSSFADHLLYDIVGRQHLPKLKALSKGLSISGDGGAYEQLTVDRMTRFNMETPDDPSVCYISYSAAFEPGFTNPFRLPWGIINEREGANDGLVSVASAQWGEHIRTLDNVNHLDLIGWNSPFRYWVAEVAGKQIDFKPVSFFLDVADSLGMRGF